jgi:preprotein translocase subunit SecD
MRAANLLGSALAVSLVALVALIGCASESDAPDSGADRSEGPVANEDRTPGTRTDIAHQTCYRLPDEPALGTDVIERAQVSLAIEDTWQVNLILTGDGLVAFNDVAAGCSQQGPECPLGRLALLVDDEIVTAPMITEPSYRRDAITVTGNFTQDQARSIANALEA